MFSTGYQCLFLRELCKWQNQQKQGKVTRKVQQESAQLSVTYFKYYLVASSASPSPCSMLTLNNETSAQMRRLGDHQRWETSPQCSSHPVWRVKANNPNLLVFSQMKGSFIVQPRYTLSLLCGLTRKKSAGIMRELRHGCPTESDLCSLALCICVLWTWVCSEGISPCECRSLWPSELYGTAVPEEDSKSSLPDTALGVMQSPSLQSNFKVYECIIYISNNLVPTVLDCFLEII